jgi:hypothetical protein
VGRKPEKLAVGHEVANGCTTGLDIEHLECQVLRIPTASVRVTHRDSLSTASIFALEGHPCCGDVLRFMAIVDSVCICLAVTNHCL